ncbi:MAG: transposase [Gammaproteobacteria bacterium]
MKPKQFRRKPQDMSICESGVESNVKPSIVAIKITSAHPLIQLCNAPDWQQLTEMVLPDLKKSTKKGQWWLGRKLKLRIHLAIYLLQQLFNKTDRQIEYDAKDNAAYQIFCGKFIVDKWHVPDHTKIEKFRSRLSPETQKLLANEIAASAVKLGFGDPSEIDVDSTVQEANLGYPSDSGLLKKMGVMAGKTAVFLNKGLKEFIKTPLTVDVKKIVKKAREYFFLSKKATKELKKYKIDVFAQCSVCRSKIGYLCLQGPQHNLYKKNPLESSKKNKPNKGLS